MSSTCPAKVSPPWRTRIRRPSGWARRTQASRKVPVSQWRGAASQRSSSLKRWRTTAARSTARGHSSSRDVAHGRSSGAKWLRCCRQLIPIPTTYALPDPGRCGAGTHARDSIRMPPSLRPSRTRSLGHLISAATPVAGPNGVHGGHRCQQGQQVARQVERIIEQNQAGQHAGAARRSPVPPEPSAPRRLVLRQNDPPIARRALSVCGPGITQGGHPRPRHAVRAVDAIVKFDVSSDPPRLQAG